MMYVDRGIPEASSHTHAGSDSDEEERNAALKQWCQHGDDSDVSSLSAERRRGSLPTLSSKHHRREGECAIGPRSHKYHANTNEGMRHHEGVLLPPTNDAPRLGGNASCLTSRHTTLDPAQLLTHASHSNYLTLSHLVAHQLLRLGTGAVSIAHFFFTSLVRPPLAAGKPPPSPRCAWGRVYLFSCRPQW
eukprot:259998-Rhodomonas_salina.1